MPKMKFVAKVARVSLSILLSLVAWSVLPSTANSSGLADLSARAPIAYTAGHFGVSHAYYHLFGYDSYFCYYEINENCNVSCGPSTFTSYRGSGDCSLYAFRTQPFVQISSVKVCNQPSKYFYMQDMHGETCSDKDLPLMSFTDCTNEGFSWDYTNSICQPGDDTQCSDLGGFWNFSNSTCNEEPQTQTQCYVASWYWNFTNSSCGTSPAIGNCNGGADWGNYASTGCYSGLSLLSGACGRSNTFINHCYGGIDGYDFNQCVCFGCDWCGGSPILVDVPGGFDLTDVNNGVQFDLNGNGTPDRLSWTRASSTAAWLVLDGNRNGTIDNGKELFGDNSYQPDPPPGVEKNGFRALAEYDKAENGGNTDGVLDNRDAYFAKMRLWRDANHNGISEASELRTLAESGLESISLDYKQSRHRDRYGNEFRYRAKVFGANHQDLGRWAYDVWLLSEK